MKLQRIIQLVTGAPWLITPAGHSSVRTLIENHLAGKAINLADIVGEPEQPRIEENGVGVIPIKGVIGKGLSKLEKTCGACDTKDVESELAQMLDDPTCKAILLDVDSPGGTVSGVPELAAKIAAADDRKPVLAFTDGQMCSAAYWLASGVRVIYASPSAEVGSIGVYMPWVDSTKAYENEGYKVEVIKNTGGTFKGMGMPGTALTDDQRAHLQERVDEIFGMFTVAATYRRKISPDAMRGQTLMAAAAKAGGLIEGIGEYSDAIQECLAQAAS